MFSRIGLVIVGLALVALVLFGILLGAGLVSVSSDGISLGPRFHEPDAASDGSPKVVSADDLLRQAASRSANATGMDRKSETIAPAASVPAAPPPKPSTPAPIIVARKPAAPVDNRPTIRIDAGSTVPVRDRKGNQWDADRGFEGGQIVDRGNIAIANTDFPDIYRTEHYGMTAWRTDLPNGNYVVKLHFAETSDSAQSAGRRVFHIDVQGVSDRDIDVFQITGGQCRALVKTYHVKVGDADHGKLTIRFMIGKDNVPEINGIEVAPE